MQSQRRSIEAILCEAAVHVPVKTEIVNEACEGMGRTPESWASMILARDCPSTLFAPSLTPKLRQTHPNL